VSPFDPDGARYDQCPKCAGNYEGVVEVDSGRRVYGWRVAYNYSLACLDVICRNCGYAFLMQTADAKVLA
jgi:hypothetical protein